MTDQKTMMSINHFYSIIQLEEIGITATKEFQLETAMVRTFMSTHISKTNRVSIEYTF